MAMLFKKRIPSDLPRLRSDKREMIFNIPKTIAYLSAGTTLEAGSLIMV